MKTRYYVEEDRQDKTGSWNVRDRDYRHVIVERFPSREAARRAARLMELGERERQKTLEKSAPPPLKAEEAERQYARDKIKIFQERQ